MTANKLAGIATIVALAAMAYMSTGTASADVLCLEPGHHASECPVSKRYSGSILGLTIGKTAIFLEADGTIFEKCHSTALGLGSTLTNEGPHIGFKILLEPLTFSQCEGFCTTVVGETPSWLLVEALTLDAFLTKDGPVPLSIKFEGCPLNVKCLYEFTNEPQLSSISGETSTLKKAPLTKTSGTFCPELDFDVTYYWTKDQVGGGSLYYAALP